MEEAEVQRFLGTQPRVRFNDIFNHPRLPEARKVYFDHFLALYSADPLMVRMTEANRFYVCQLAMILEAAPDVARRETWPSIGLLKRKMAPLGFASGRQIDQVIPRLCTLGLLQLQPSPHDRRVRILSTTEKLRAHDRGWLVAHYVPLAFLFPQFDYGPVLQRDPAFQQLHRAMCVQFAGVAAKIMFATTVPGMMVFFERTAGYMLIATLLAAATEATDYLHASLRYGDIGDRFGVSRTHVRKMLLAAQDLNLVKLHGRGGSRVEILPALWLLHDRGMAGGMYIHDVVYQATLNFMKI